MPFRDWNLTFHFSKTFQGSSNGLFNRGHSRLLSLLNLFRAASQYLRDKSAYSCSFQRQLTSSASARDVSSTAQDANGATQGAYGATQGAYGAARDVSAPTESSRGMHPTARFHALSTTVQQTHMLTPHLTLRIYSPLDSFAPNDQLRSFGSHSLPGFKAPLQALLQERQQAQHQGHDPRPCRP